MKRRYARKSFATVIITAVIQPTVTLTVISGLLGEVMM